MKSCAGRDCLLAPGASTRVKVSARARRKQSTASVPPIRISTMTNSCGRTGSAGLHETDRRDIRNVALGRQPGRAATLLARGDQPLIAGACVVSVREARSYSEVCTAIALRDVARA